MISRVSRIAGMFAVVVTIGVLAWSTTYFVVYLGRWEWNRAIVSGIVALGLLVVLSTVIVVRRVAALDHRLDLELHRLSRRADSGSSPATGSVATGSVATGSAAEAPARTPRPADDGRSRFDWLTPTTSPPRDAGVFIPVLLGTGVILSLVAAAIERIAALMSGTTLDRRTAQLVPLDLPLSSHPRVRAHDLADLVEPPARTAHGDPAHRRHRRLLSALVVLALVGGGVESIRRVTQTSVGAIDEQGTTTVVVQVDTKRSRTPLAAAESMWALCRPRIDEPGLISSRTDPTDPSVVTLEIDRALRTTAERRLTGCFEDLVLDYARLDVLSVTPHPATGG